MIKEVADKWIEALRSGKFHQGRGLLKQERIDGSPAYCCLGVLQEAVLHLPIEMNNEAVLSALAQFNAGMRTDIGNLPTKPHSLAYCNDGGASFSKIADLIQEHWREL